MEEEVLEWAMTLSDDSNGLLERIWVNERFGVVMEEVFTPDYIDVSYTVCRTHRSFNFYRELMAELGEPAAAIRLTTDEVTQGRARWDRGRFRPSDMDADRTDREGDKEWLN